MSCRSSIGIPVYVKQVLGNYIPNANTSTMASKALIVTYLLNNGPTAGIAAAWEKEFLKIVGKPRKTMNIYRSAEVCCFLAMLNYFLQRSVEDELGRETYSDLWTIAISYVAMFFYVAISLGQIHPIRSKVVVGFGGIVIVIMSVIISAGIWYV